MNYTLVVIDMQNYFWASRGNRVRKSCAREIRLAVERKLPIIFVEYDGFGSTIPSLRNLVKGYPLVSYTTKSSTDGGDEVMSIITQKNYHSQIRMAGVEISCCVYDTAASLSYTHKVAVTLVADACNNYRTYKSEIKKDLDMFKALPGCKVVRNIA